MHGTDTAQTISIPEMAKILGINERSVRRRSECENWQFVQGPRKVKLYYINSLPEDVKMAVISQRAKDMAQSEDYLLPLPIKKTLIVSSNPANTQVVPVGSPDLADWQNRIALAWADLIRLYTTEKNNAKSKGISKVEAAKIYIKGYNTGSFLPNVFAAIGKTSVKSVERQYKKYRDSAYDYAVLAPKWGGSLGRSKVTDDEFNIMLSFALHPNKLKISEVVRLTKMKLKKEGIESPSCKDTLRRAIVNWRKTNEDKWVFCREGEKALNDKCLPYLERDINVLDVGDVLVADGHVLNFLILNPFTGKPCRMSMVMWYDWASCMPVGWEIMPTENIQCVAAGLRRAIITLRKMPKIAYLDNGKAFKAKVFTDKNIDFEEAGFYGMFARLGVETIFAWPYNAQSKPVERFFGTFSELERLMPTYSGTSIETKPAHMLRNEKLHQKLHEKRYGGWVPTIDEANNIIAGWVNGYSARPHRGLKGLCPGEVLKSGQGKGGVDEVAIRYLMMSMEIKRIKQNGVSFMGRSYYDDALYGMRDRVTIKYDFEDLSKVFVYDLTGARYICTAEALEKVHPMAKLLGTKDDMALVKEGIKRKKSAKKQTEKVAREWVESAPALVEIPERIGHGAEGMAKMVEIRREPGKLTPEEAAQIELEASEMKILEIRPKKKEPIYMSEPDRYEDLLERECKGEELALDDMAFMRYFEKTDMYKQLKVRFDFLYEHFMAPDEAEERV
jgi:putative transposase